MVLLVAVVTAIVVALLFGAMSRRSGESGSRAEAGDGSGSGWAHLGTGDSHGDRLESSDAHDSVDDGGGAGDVGDGGGGDGGGGDGGGAD